MLSVGVRLKLLTGHCFVGTAIYLSTFDIHFWRADH
jgi:hypothetical protein